MEEVSVKKDNRINSDRCKTQKEIKEEIKKVPLTAHEPGTA